MGRHTNATPKNVDLCPTLTPLEEQAVESDRALVTCKTKSRALADTSFPGTRTPFSVVYGTYVIL